MRHPLLLVGWLTTNLPPPRIGSEDHHHALFLPPRTSAMANLAIGELTPPSSEESSWYFHGIAGGKLVARTNARESPWQGCPTQTVSWGGPTPVPKIYVALGTEPTIDTRIATTLRPHLSKIVTEVENVPWTWFTAIRIGYCYSSGRATSVDAQYPVVLLINVEFGTKFEQVAPVTKRLKRNLESIKLMIHIEVREHEICDHAAITSNPQLQHVLNLEQIVKNEYWGRNDEFLRYSQELLPLLSSFGWEVINKDHKIQKNGTAGVYLRFPGDNNLFVTSCHHVHLPQVDNPKAIRVWKGDDGPDVSEGNDETLNDLLGVATNRLNSVQSAFSNEIAKVKRFDEWLNARSGPMPDEPSTSERKMAIIPMFLSEIVDALKTVTGPRGQKDRQVGMIYAAPEFHVSSSQKPAKSQTSVSDPELIGMLNDWVLIRLYERKFKTASNKMYLGRDGFEALVKSHGDSFETPLIPPMEEPMAMRLREDFKSKDWFLHLKGHLQGPTPDLQTKGKPGIPCVRVAKRGRTTGLTFGVTNAIEAVVRVKVEPKLNKYQKEIVRAKSACSWELLVVPYPDRAATRARFSEPGDSGAAILAFDGTFMGQVVSGGPSGPVKERQWRGQLEVSGNPGKPTLYEKGKMPHAVKPEDPEMESFQPGMDVTFVHMAWALLRDIEQFVGKKPAFL
ncbi:hypothetical protein PG990_001050 [Apiospora arundinis]